MKIAVLINGNFHPYLRREILKENLSSLQKIFSGCDIFYQTWDSDEDRHIFKDIRNIVDIKWVPKPPLASYDPYLKAVENLPKKDFSGINRIKNSSESGKLMRAHGCFQHISLLEQFNSIPKDYDFYIRTRWDAYFNNEFPLSDILELAKHNVIGIATIPNHSSVLAKTVCNQNDNYLRVRSRRKSVKKQVDRGIYCIIDEVGSNNDYSPCKWNNYLKDFCIVFKKDDIIDFDIMDHYVKENLYGAEYGWHQILCRKRKHINIDGLVSIYRNIDTSKGSYDTLNRVNML